MALIPRRLSRWPGRLIAAVLKLSTRDGLIYTVQRTVAGSTPAYAMVAIDSGTGQTVSTRALGTGPQFEANQLAGVTNREGTLYQGTVAGIMRIQPAVGLSRR